MHDRLNSTMFSDLGAYNSWPIEGRLIPFWVRQRGCQKETAPWCAVTACVHPWPNELHSVAFLRPKTQSCVGGEWIEAWRSSLLVFQVGSWFDLGTISKKINRKLIDLQMRYERATVCCLADRFILEPNAFVETLIAFLLRSWNP